MMPSHITNSISSASPRTKVTFHGFSNFPPELRYRIWDMAREGRVITFQSGGDLKGQPRSAIRFVPSVPPLLHVCRESRNLADKFYKRESYRVQVGYKVSSQRANAYFWADFDVDTVLVRLEEMFLLAQIFDISKLRLIKLTFPHTDQFIFKTNAPAVAALRYLLHLPRLENVVVDMPLPHDPLGVKHQPWHPWAYMIMIDCYATCTPVGFDLSIIDSGCPDKGVLNRDNLLDSLNTLRVEDIPKDTPHAYKLFDDPNTCFMVNKDCPKYSHVWKHVGCDCNHDILDSQRNWKWRI